MVPGYSDTPSRVTLTVDGVGRERVGFYTVPDSTLTDRPSVPYFPSRPRRLHPSVALTSDHFTRRKRPVDFGTTLS